jgi:hypothetical protein
MSNVGASVRLQRLGSSLVVLGGVGDLCGLLPIKTVFSSKDQFVRVALQLGWEFEAEMPVGGPESAEVIYLFGHDEGRTATS